MRNTITIVTILSLLISPYYLLAQCATLTNIHSFTYNGETYEIVKENKTWIEAAECAVERGGILAEINDSLEQNAIFNELNLNAGINVMNTRAPDGGGGSYVWIGGNDLLVEGNWIWDGNNDSIGTQFWMGTTTGNPVGGLYNNWGNEPDNAAFGGQNALGLSLNGWPLGTPGQWNDVIHTNALYYVIEHAPVICNSTLSTINEIACNSFTSPSGKIWNTSNTYLDTISNTAGCDSIITVNLTINEVTTSSITEITCNNFTSPSGKVWTTSNTYLDTISNNAGCDSIITVNLTINEVTTSNITEIACDSFSSPSGKIWAVSDTYLDTISNTNGCDSIITIDLTINNIDTSLSISGNTITSNAVGATYQWIDCNNGNSSILGANNQDFTPTTNGSYAVEITQNLCTNSSRCVNIIASDVFNNFIINQLSIYPNPSNGLINIDFGEIVNPSIEVLNSLGQLIFKKNNINMRNYQFELKEASGIYILKLITERKEGYFHLLFKQ